MPKLDNEPEVIIEGVHQGIVSESLFNKVQPPFRQLIILQRLKYTFFCLFNNFNYCNQIIKFKVLYYLKALSITFY